MQSSPEVMSFLSFTIMDRSASIVRQLQTRQIHWLCPQVHSIQCRLRSYAQEYTNFQMAFGFVKMSDSILCYTRLVSLLIVNLQLLSPPLKPIKIEQELSTFPFLKVEWFVRNTNISQSKLNHFDKSTKISRSSYSSITHEHLQVCLTKKSVTTKIYLLS